MATFLNRGLTFDDVLLVPGYNPVESRQDVSLDVELGLRTYNIPIISANMDTITGVDMAVAMTSLGGLAPLHRFQSLAENEKMYQEAKDACRKASLSGINTIACSVGVGPQELERYHRLYNVGCRIFFLDIANAYSKSAGIMLRKMREEHKDTYIIAGNVATYAGADHLAREGADAIKVGIGAGSVCTTREKTGFGVPQLTSIMDCAKIDLPIIADGGIRKPGDVVKALAAGATMVMLGGMLAGTDEALGGQMYRGMASASAQTDFFGNIPTWKTSEGITTYVSKKGPVELVINDITGGLRSGMTYAGAYTIKELQRKANFVEVTRAVAEEGTPHAAR